MNEPRGRSNVGNEIGLHSLCVGVITAVGKDCHERIRSIVHTTPPRQACIASEFVFYSAAAVWARPPTSWEHVLPSCQFCGRVRAVQRNMSQIAGGQGTEKRHPLRAMFATRIGVNAPGGPLCPS